MPAVNAQRYMTQATWKDAPHLSEAQQEAMLANIAPHLRAARSQGIPTMGSGVIYPLLIEEIEVRPFAIPDFWPKAYGMDVGWNRTAGIWGALDRATDTVYLYSEYYAGKQVPEVHATGIKARGDWIPGVIDPASRGRSQVDGEQLMTTYQALGLKVSKADNSVESGLQMVWSRLQTGRMKVFSTLRNFKTEFQLYKRDENGKIVKVDDHLMDAMRYLTVSGIPLMKVQEFRRISGPGSSGPADQTVGI